MFWLRKKKNYFLLHTLILGPASDKVMYCYVLTFNLFYKFAVCSSVCLLLSYEETHTFNSLPTSSEFCRLLMIFSNSMDSD